MPLVINLGISMVNAIEKMDQPVSGLMVIKSGGSMVNSIE
jgi:hypothetical protein